MALQPVPRQTSAISMEAEVVRKATSAVVDSAERSQALFGGKAAALSELWALVHDCSEAGWDGNDASPLDTIAANRAVEFIRALPIDFPLPEFAPEPDGSISLDWIESRTRLFSLSISASNRLAYAWLDGTDKGHAVALFNGSKIPQRVLDGIDSIVNHGSPTLRAA